MNYRAECVVANGGPGCCTVGSTCTTCLDPGYVMCPNDTFCCREGLHHQHCLHLLTFINSLATGGTCSRDPSGVPKCSSSGIILRGETKIPSTDLQPSSTPAVTTATSMTATTTTAHPTDNGLNNNNNINGSSNKINNNDGDSGNTIVNSNSKNSGSEGLVVSGAIAGLVIGALIVGSALV